MFIHKMSARFENLIFFLKIRFIEKDKYLLDRLFIRFLYLFLSFQYERPFTSYA